MPCAPGSVSVVVDPTSTHALTYTPMRGTSGGEIRLYATHTRFVDAAIAVTLRATLEHFCGYVRVPVSLTEPPADDEVWRMLDALLGADLPEAFTVASGPPGGGPPSTVIMPATRINSEDVAAQIADALVDPLGANYGRRVMFYIAGSFLNLVENGLLHAADSTVDVIAAVSYDRERDEVRLAVTDTGTALSSSPDPLGALREALDQSRDHDGGLDDLAARARIPPNEVSITLASGAARANSDGGDWTFEAGEHIDGFSAIVSIKAH